MTPDGLKRIYTEEGFRSVPYTDTRGFLTVGYGTNLSAGLSSEEAAALVQIKIDYNRKQLVLFSWFADLDSVRQDVLEDMVYNMGLSAVLNFKGMIAALVAKNYAKASEEMLNSAWAKEVPHRAQPLSMAMRNGPEA